MNSFALALMVSLALSAPFSPAVTAAAVPERPAVQAREAVPEVPEVPKVYPSSPEGAPVTYEFRLPVLMYHHVVPDGQKCNEMTVTVGRLEQDLRWLAENGYPTVLPRELAAGEPLPEKPVLITFDDGYRSNYNLAFPIFQEFEAKMVISVMVYMQDNAASDFITWAMCREMIDSGLIEIGSHTYLLHNLDERGGSFDPEGVNGVQRKPDETAEAFQTRVLDDIQRSYDLIAEKLEVSPTFFAYPFGLTEPDADELIRELFPVTAVTLPKTANLTGGLYDLPRHTVTMNKSLDSILNPPLKTVVKAGIKEFLGLS